MKLRLFYTTVLFLLIGVCSGCSLLTQKHYHPIQNQAEQQALSALKHWAIKGKIGIKANDRAKSANVQWQNRDDTFSIRLHGILGLGGVKLTKSQKQYTLTTNKETYTASSAESLLFNSTGWDLPISELSYWIKGIPSPNTEIHFLNSGASNQILELHQLGWQIKYLRHTDIDDLVLPTKIVATRDELKLTFIIKDWETGAQ